MLNILWPILIIISFAFGIITGKADELTQSIFDSTSDAIQLCISLLRYDMPLEWNNANCNKNELY